MAISHPWTIFLSRKCQILYVLYPILPRYVQRQEYDFFFPTQILKTIIYVVSSGWCYLFFFNKEYKNVWLELNWIKINYFECFDFDGLDDYWHYGVAFAPLVNAVSYVRQGDQISQSNAHKLCIWMAWRLCVCDNAASTRLNGQIATGTRENGTCMASLLKYRIWKFLEGLNRRKKINT